MMGTKKKNIESEPHRATFNSISFCFLITLLEVLKKILDNPISSISGTGEKYEMVFSESVQISLLFP